MLVFWSSEIIEKRSDQLTICLGEREFVTCIFLLSSRQNKTQSLVWLRYDYCTEITRDNQKPFQTDS